MQTFRVAVLYALGLLLMGCQSTPSKLVDDPLEPLNRRFFWFNQKLDSNAAEPAAVFYRSSVPGGLRDGLHGVLQNIGLPVSFANDVLQLEFKRAGTAAERFGVNTTVGILGWNDRATEMGLPSQPEDFGQTLGVYGTPGGPYLVLPLFGPTLPRDAVGRIFVDHYFSPLGYVSYSGKYYVSLGERLFSTVDGRARAIEELHDIERSSMDYYAAMREAYAQKRDDQIHNRMPSDVDMTAN